MSEERLVKPPAHARVFVIPQEYLAICRMERQRKISVGERAGEITTYFEQNEVAAAILRIVERWSVWKMKQSGKAKDSDLWVYIPQVMMEEWELLGAFSESKITQAFRFLVEKGFLQRRRNPSPGKQWDRTYQYLFDAEKIQAAIDALPSFPNIKEWKAQYYGMDSLKLGDRLPNIEDAIPQIPRQIPETDKSAPSPHGDEAAGRPPSAQQLMFEAVCVAFGFDWRKMTPSKRKNIGRIANELTEAGATPSDIPGFHRWCKAQDWPDFTENVFATRWDDYKAERRPASAAKFSQHFPAPVHDCGMCGGTGQLRDADNRSIPCPACLAAEQGAADERAS